MVDEFSQLPHKFRLGLNDVTTSAIRLHVHRREGLNRIILSDICVVSKALANGAESKPVRVLPPYPMQVKRVLDAELLDNGVNFLYGSHVVDVLKDAQGNVSGVVLTNRSGWQNVRAKVIIDATESGLVAKLAGARFGELPAEGVYTRYILGGNGKVPAEGTVSRFPNDIQITGGQGRLETFQPVWKYSFHHSVQPWDVRGMMEFENRTRDLTWNDGIVECTGRLEGLACAPVLSQGRYDGAVSVDSLPMSCLRPEGIPNLLMTGRHADVPSADRVMLQGLRESIELGVRIGEFAAEIAEKQPSVASAVASAQISSSD